MREANEVRSQRVQCAACGEALELAAGACDGCHFVYCVEHRDGDDHECEVICAECPDDFEGWFWRDAAH